MRARSSKTRRGHTVYAGNTRLDLTLAAGSRAGIGADDPSLSKFAA
jgi:hypothetical protein